MAELIPLCTAIVEVAAPLAVGDGPSGNRSVSAIHTVTVEGERCAARSPAPPPPTGWPAPARSASSTCA